MRVVLVMNQPYPYRVPVLDLLAGLVDLTAVYSSRCEANRTWMPEIHHKAVWLKERTVKYGVEGFLHVNPDILKVLRDVSPDVVICYGFGPTEQLAFLWAKLHRRGVIVMADCWAHTERNRTWRQRWIQRRMIRGADCCIVAGHKGRNYFRDMGAKCIVICPIGIDQEVFRP
jgi:hypothetical protein